MEIIKKPQLDFNEESDLNSIVNQLASKEAGKKMNINIKLVAIISGYFMLSGIGLNIYWIVKLIIKLF